MATTRRSLDDYLSFKPMKQEVKIPLSPEENEELDKKSVQASKANTQKAKVVKTPTGTAQEHAPLEIFGDSKRGVSEAQTIAPPAPTPQPAPTAPAQQQGSGIFTPATQSVQTSQTPTIQPSSGPSAWERALVGATPLLVGWLTGNQLEGTEAAGNQLANTEADRYKREADFNTKLAQMQAQASMKKASGKGLQAKTFEYKGSDGQPRIGRFVNGEYYYDETTDPLASVKATKDSWITKTINTENGPREIAYNPATQETREIGEHYDKPQRQVVDVDFQGDPTKAVANLSSGKLESYLGKVATKPLASENGKDERQIRQIRVGLLKDITKPTSVYSQRRESLEGMARAATLLNDGGPIGASGLRMILARSVFGEKGPLSDGDVSRLSGDPSAQATVSRLYDKFLEGRPLTEQDRNDVRKVIDVAAKLSTEDANRYLDGYLNTYKSEGYDLGPQLSHFREMPQIPGMVSGKRGIQAAKGVNSPEAGMKKDGYTFKGGDPSKQENWEKH